MAQEPVRILKTGDPFSKLRGDPGHRRMMFEELASVLNRAKGLPATQIRSDEKRALHNNT